MIGRSLRLPFTTEQFFQAFADYNAAVWPAQLFLFALGFTLAALAWFGPAGAARWIAWGFAVLWAWMGGMYHLMVFRAINPAATVFGVAFLTQAVLFAVWGLRRANEPAGRVVGMPAWIGGTLLGYALFIYPALAWFLGQRYPAIPTFGLPCPTTIATLGLLTWIRPAPPAWLVIVPLAWVLVGGSAAVTLGVSEDFGLPAAGLAYGLAYFGRRGRTDHAQH